MQRRDFARTLLAGSAALAAEACFGTAPVRAKETAKKAEPAATAGSLTDVPGIKVGHYTDPRRPTGATVVLLDPGAVAGCDIRGSASGTIGTDTLNPLHVASESHALFLAGGSAFGLQVGAGVERYLEERGRGFQLAGATIPLVAGAILFDLELGDHAIRPDAEAGYRAAQAAGSAPVAEGNVGAGAGATVGKLFGMEAAMKTGLGTASLQIGTSGVWVGAVVAVNAVGDIVDPATAGILAGARDLKGRGWRDTGFLNTIEQIKRGYGTELAPQQRTNTTIGIVATNARLDRVQVTKVAQMAHDGMARTINPVHTLWDGDTLFAVATGKSEVRVNHSALGAVAAEVLATAIVRAATQAAGIPGLPSWRDLRGRR